MRDNKSLQEIRKLWQQEMDKYVLEAATKDINEYPPDVRTVIQEEALKRGLLKEKNQESVIQNGVSFDKLTDKLINASSGIKQACFCPVCKEIWPVSDIERCSKCNIFLENAGYCEECSKFWALPLGSLCPNDQTKLADKKRFFSQKLANRLGTGLCFVLCYVVYEYFGLVLSIPTIGVLICLWVTNKLLSPAKKPMLLAIGWQSGFVLSFLLIGALAGELSGPAMAELLLTAGVLVWLIVRPRVAPVIVLTILHILTLVAIALAIFIDVELESITPTYKGLLFNLVFRAPAIVFMLVGLRGIRRQGKREVKKLAVRN